MDKTKPPTLMLHLDSLQGLTALTDEQAGKLFKALVKYSAEGELTNIDDSFVAFAFSTIKPFIDRDHEHWRETKQKRADYAKSHWKDRYFTEFWNAYPCKDNEAEAREIFYAITAKQADILKELKYWKEQNREWLSGNIPPANDWLSERGNANGWFDLERTPP